MSLWDLTAVIGAALAVAGFIVLCLLLFWGRRNAPNHWEEQRGAGNDGVLTWRFLCGDKAWHKFERNARAPAQRFGPRKFRCPTASSLVVNTDYEIRSGRRAVSIKSAPSAQQALLDYVRSLGCKDAEIVRLGAAAVVWRGARYTAVEVPSSSAP